MLTMKPIGIVRSPFTDTASIPKGPGAKHEEEGALELLPEFEPGLADIEGFSHLYVIWAFDRAEGYDLESQPPGESDKHGVFATRSPRRPNPIGLTVVRLLGRDGSRLKVRGVDMLEGTPILDIKPYLSSVPEGELRRGWLGEADARRAAASTNRKEAEECIHTSFRRSGAGDFREPPSRAGDDASDSPLRHETPDGGTRAATAGRTRGR
jgi:tRNA-Thr(GGU) m(6)t(6)A37 methyltransferase TsaA